MVWGNGNALRFGAYLLKRRDGQMVDMTLERIASDNYKYLAGIIPADDRLLLYAEAHGHSRAGYHRKRASAYQQWATLAAPMRQMIEVDPDADILPNLGRVYGWRWFRNATSANRVASSFAHETGVRACLYASGGSSLRLYLEYMERGVEVLRRRAGWQGGI